MLDADARREPATAHDCDACAARVSDDRAEADERDVLSRGNRWGFGRDERGREKKTDQRFSSASAARSLRMRGRALPQGLRSRTSRF